MQEIFNSYFNDTQLSLLLCGGFLLLLGFYSLHRQKNTWTLVSLIGVAICIFSFSALLDPFLNLWDERFHALVAKNMMSDPFRPTLYNDMVVNIPYDTWDRYHIWLHKQPLFLWQISLSFKLFGVSEFALRIPSIILGAVFTGIVFRIGSLLFSARSGFIAALLFISSAYAISLISGRQAVEHNDFSFLVYVSLSIWAFIEYYHSKKKYWIILIGLFAGFAILCKWLVGLLVYFGWGILKAWQKKYSFRENSDYLLSLLVTGLVTIPWQIYTLVRFPSEANAAFEYNSRHFSEPIEGHDGDMFYHFEQFSELYGTLMPFIILPAFYIAFKRMKDKKLFWSLSLMVIAVYLFFTLAATKMPSFTLVIGIVIFLFLGSFFDHLFSLISKKAVRNLAFFAGIVVLFFIRLDIESLQEKHTTWRDSNEYTQKLTENKEVFESMNLSSNAVLFNVPGRHYVEAMFYTNCIAYNVIPTKEQIKDLKKKGKRLVVLKNNNETLPEYINEDESISIINAHIHRIG